MSVCSGSLGYNWDGQVTTDGNIMPDWSTAISLTGWKIADYCPLISLISGISKIIFAIGLLADWEEMKANQKCDTVFVLIRGALSTCQLGIIFLPIDLIMTVVNGILSYKENN